MHSECDRQLFTIIFVGVFAGAAIGFLGGVAITLGYLGYY